VKIGKRNYFICSKCGKVFSCRGSEEAPNSYPDSCVCDKCYLRENGEKPSPCGVREVKGKRVELIRFLILLRRGMRK